MPKTKTKKEIGFITKNELLAKIKSMPDDTDFFSFTLVNSVRHKEDGHMIGTEKVVWQQELNDLRRIPNDPEKRELVHRRLED